MSKKDCVIVFDQNEYGTYFTGQTITGKVIISFNKPKKIRAIKLQIYGYAICQWKDSHGKKTPQLQEKKAKKTQDKRLYSGRKDYIASTRFLMGSEHSRNFTMNAGTYTYTFSCPIPDNCPSSFEGAYGYIRYLTKVTFQRAGCSDRVQNVGFTVLKLLDLNQENRILRAPAHNEVMENICFLQSRPVQMRVDLMQTGYVPGQFILVSTHVSNESSIDCKKLVITLNLVAIYTSDTPCMRTTKERICLVKKVCGPVAHNSVKDFAESVRVPATPPTCEHLSKVVRVSYEICVEAVMNPFIRNPRTFIPITIGNVPLTDDLPTMSPSCDDVPTTSSGAMQRAASSEQHLTSDQLDVATEDEAEDDLPELPPTYEEAMFMTTNIADDDTNTVSEAVSFTPRYPVYDVDSMVNRQTPPPNKPQKRRRRRARSPPIQEQKEEPPVESPVQI